MCTFLRIIKFNFEWWELNAAILFAVVYLWVSLRTGFHPLTKCSRQGGNVYTLYKIIWHKSKPLCQFLFCWFMSAPFHIASFKVLLLFVMLMLLKCFHLCHTTWTFSSSRKSFDLIIPNKSWGKKKNFNQVVYFHCGVFFWANRRSEQVEILYWSYYYD